MLIEQQASQVPSAISPSSSSPRPLRSSIASRITVLSSIVGIRGGYLASPCCSIFSKRFIDSCPLRRSLSHFWMVFSFPRSSDGAKRVALTIQLDFPLCQIDQEGRAMPVADDLVNLGNDLGRIGLHNPSAWHKAIH